MQTGQVCSSAQVLTEPERQRAPPADVPGAACSTGNRRKAHRSVRSIPMLGTRNASAQVPPTQMATDLDARETNSEALTCNLVSHELAGFDLANAPKETPELLLGHVLG